MMKESIVRKVSRMPAGNFKGAPEHILKEVAIIYNAGNGTARIIYRDRDGVGKIIGNTFSSNGRDNFFILDDCQYKALRPVINKSFYKWDSIPELLKNRISKFVEGAASSS